MLSVWYLLIAAILFLIGALAQLFHWNLGDVSVHFWGLFFFVLSFLAPQFDTIKNSFKNKM